MRIAILLVISLSIISCTSKGGDTMLSNEKADYAYNQVVVSYLSGDLKKAEAGFLEIIKSYPEYSPAYVMLGKVYFFANDMKKAEETFKTALSKSPNVISYIWLSKIAVANNTNALAFDYLNSALSLDLSNPLTHYELAKYYEREKKFEKAIYHYNYAISYEAMYLDVKLDLAKLYTSLGAYEQALALYRNLQKEEMLSPAINSNINAVVEEIKKRVGSNR